MAQFVPYVFRKDVCSKLNLSHLFLAEYEECNEAFIEMVMPSNARCNTELDKS